MERLAPLVPKDPLDRRVPPGLLVRTVLVALLVTLARRETAD